ncbi:MAG: S41 family peptidase [Aggregatilineales bacterium]
MHNPSNRKQQTIRSVALGLALGLGLALVFAGGFFLRDMIGLRSPVVALSGTTTYPLLDEVQVLIDRYFVREQPDYTMRQYGAVRGLLGTLNDPFTFFIEPPVAASESDALAGTYGGIGVQIQRTADGELLLYPFEDSPALEAGIEAGDRLLAVDGRQVDITQSPDALDQMLRGEVRAGNGVTLTVQKFQSGDEFTTFIPFAVINIPSIVWRVLSEAPQIGYLQIMRFTSRTPAEVEEAIADLRQQGIEALVLDLRGNTGGLLQESIRVADAFLDDGVIVYERSSSGERALQGSAGGAALDLPLVVLVNHRTASGAELVAGALQDRNRALLIGQTTYGKGTVQQIFPLSDGSSLHVTSSEWFTPARQPLDQVGLTPDIVMIPDAEGRDVELDEAIRQLQSKLADASMLP